MDEKKDPEIQKWGKSLIERLVGLHNYLHLRLEKTKNKAERIVILDYKNLLRDIQLFIEKDL